MREDVAMAMEELLKPPRPLDDVYKEFKDREDEHMDTIRDSIESGADIVLKREAERESRR